MPFARLTDDGAPEAAEPYNTPHNAHALTFSVYRRRPYLTLPGVAEAFLARLDAARRRDRFEVWAYVVMPDHVHVVLNPLEEVYAVAAILKAIKAPTATDFFGLYPEFREELRAGRNEFRLWQAGGGYDRNPFTARATWAEIRYVHSNPVQKGLCETWLDWPGRARGRTRRARHSSRWICALGRSTELQRQKREPGWHGSCQMARAGLPVRDLRVMQGAAGTNIP